MENDLISRNATLERMKSMAGCATCDNYNYVRCRACSWNDAMNVVEEMSKVDAVPVEWMREKMRGYASSLKSTELSAVVRVMQMWDKEQEAQDG